MRQYKNSKFKIRVQVHLYKKSNASYWWPKKKQTHIINHQKKSMLIAKHCQLRHWWKVSIHSKQAGNINTNDFFNIKNTDVFKQLLKSSASKMTKASHLLMQKKFHRGSYRKLQTIYNLHWQNPIQDQKCSKQLLYMI